MNSSEFRYQFGAFQLHTARREVTSLADGRVLELKPRAFDTLLFFIEHPGALLDKATLLKAIWPDTVVEENNLNQHISALRRVLAEHDAATPYIVTVPRRGYQLAVTVRTVPGSAGSPPRVAPESRQDAAFTTDLPAQQLYEQARALAARPSESNLRMTISLLQEATVRDPGFARAFGALSVAHATLAGMGIEFDAAVTNAEAAATQALALDAHLAEAHAVLGFAAACRCKWSEAAAHFASAMALDSQDVLTRCWRAACLTGAAGYMRLTLQEHQETYRLSPGHPTTLIIMAYLHLQFGRDAEALKCVDLAAGLGFAGAALPVPFIRAQVAQRRGRYAEAASHMHQLTAGVTRAPEANALVDTVYAALAGSVHKSDAATAIRAQTLSSGVAVLNPVRFARPLLLWATTLGDLDLAYDVANAILEDFRRSGLVRVAVGLLAQLWTPELRPLRQDPRFAQLTAGLGLLDFWACHGPPDQCELRDGKLACF